MNESEADLRERLAALQGSWCELPKVVPSFSCGAHPGVVQALVKRFGKDIMVTAGGAIHGHPMGIRAGAMAFRQAVNESGPAPPELAAAIDEWGTVR